MSVNVSISRVIFPSDHAESSRIFNTITDIGNGAQSTVVSGSMKEPMNLFNTLVGIWISVLDQPETVSLEATSFGFTFYYVGKHYIVTCDFLSTEEYEALKPDEILDLLKQANYPVDNTKKLATTLIYDQPEPGVNILMQLYEQETEEPRELAYYITKAIEEEKA